MLKTYSLLTVKHLSLATTAVKINAGKILVFTVKAASGMSLMLEQADTSLLPLAGWRERGGGDRKYFFPSSLPREEGK